MALRALSGILVTRGHRSGSATIHFSDHSVTGTLDRAEKTQEVGPSGRFLSVPCKIVSLREIWVYDRGGRTDFPDRPGFEINDTTINRDYMEIEWRVTGSERSDLEEISYMIIGEVPDR